MEDLKFIKAVRKTIYAVEAHYELSGVGFVVEWNICRPDSLDYYEQYDLTLDVTPSSDTDAARELSCRVSAAISDGEGGSDDGIYLAIRDTFDSNDCESAELDFNASKPAFRISDVQVFVTDEFQHDFAETGWSVNFAINDEFMIQYDLVSGFSIPHPSEANWNARGEVVQRIASTAINANELAEYLKLPTTLIAIFENFSPDVYGGDFAKAELAKVIGK